MKYTVEIKTQLVTRFLDGESMSALSSETGIPKSTLYSWVQLHIPTKSHLDRSPTIHQYNTLKSHAKKLENMIEVLQKVGCCVSSPLKEKLNAMEALHGEYSVRALCDALKVPRGTYYNHIFRNKRNNSVYIKQREELKPIIQSVFDEHRQIFSAAKVTAVLQDRGYKTSEKTVRSLMREMGLSSVSPGSKRDYQIWKKGENRNIVQQQFTAVAPNKVWVSDVTYFNYNNTAYYLCVIIDLYSRKVVAHRISKKNSTALVTKTFRVAYAARQPEPGLIFHSDRGSAYISKTFSKLLHDCKAVQSLSRSGKPHDNAVSESFFSYLKREELYRRQYKSETNFFRSIDEYIQFYNQKRPHYYLNYKTPDKAEETADMKPASQ